MDSREINISWAALWKVLAMAVFVVVLFVSREVLIATLLAIIISSALDPFVTYLERRRIPRLLGTLAIYILMILVVALIVYIVVPIFLVELNTLLTNSTDIFGSAAESLNINISIFETIAATINQFTADLLGGQTSLVGILSQILGGLLMMIIVFVISFYLTIGRDGVERFLTTILPPTYQVPVLNVYERVRHKISFWFAGQLFLSIVVGIAVFVGLTLLGVKYAFILGITAAVFEIVPYVGPIISGGVAVLTALSGSTTLGLYALILFLVIQQLESNFLVPAVNKYTTNLNPVIVIVSLLIGGKVFGIVGVILAVPVAVMFQEILQHWSLSQRAEQISTQ
jgi:predicted PurR-regulated permease PerM